MSQPLSYNSSLSLFVLGWHWGYRQQNPFLFSIPWAHSAPSSILMLPHIYKTAPWLYVITQKKSFGELILSHTAHTKHLIIPWYGLVYCRNVMATWGASVRSSPFTCIALKKIISRMKDPCRHLKLNSLSPPFYHYYNLPCRFHPTLIQYSLPEISLIQISYSFIEPLKETLWI